MLSFLLPYEFYDASIGLIALVFAIRFLLLSFFLLAVAEDCLVLRDGP